MSNTETVLVLAERLSVAEANYKRCLSKAKSSPEFRAAKDGYHRALGYYRCALVNLPADELHALATDLPPTQSD